MRRPHIEKLFGKTATLEVICKELKRSISTNRQRTIDQVSKKLNIKSTGEGKGSQEVFEVIGYASFRSDLKGRPIPHESDLTNIYHNFLFEIRDSKFDKLTHKLTNKNYQYVTNTQSLLSRFGYYNQDYCLNKEIFKYRIGGTEKAKKLYEELSSMKKEVLEIIKFYDSKKKSLIKYLDKCDKWAERFKTFWVVIGGKEESVFPADRYYCVPTTYLIWEDFFEYYLEEREKQIEEKGKEIKDWHMKFIKQLKGEKNPIRVLNKYDSEKKPFKQIFISYCYSIPPVEPRGRKKYPKDILPYAHGFILHRLPPSLKRIDEDVIKQSVKNINESTIEELRDYTKKKDLNMKNVEYIIEKYIRVK